MNSVKMPPSVTLPKQDPVDQGRAAPPLVQNAAAEEATQSKGWAFKGAKASTADIMKAALKEGPQALKRYSTAELQAANAQLTYQAAMYLQGGLGNVMPPKQGAKWVQGLRDTLLTNADATAAVARELVSRGEQPQWKLPDPLKDATAIADNAPALVTQGKANETSKKAPAQLKVPAGASKETALTIEVLNAVAAKQDLGGFSTAELQTVHEQLTYQVTMYLQGGLADKLPKGAADKWVQGLRSSLMTNADASCAVAQELVRRFQQPSWKVPNPLKDAAAVAELPQNRP